MGFTSIFWRGTDMDSYLAIKCAMWLFCISIVVVCTRFLMPKSWVDERQMPIGVGGAMLFAGVVAFITGLVLTLVGR